MTQPQGPATSRTVVAGGPEGAPVLPNRVSWGAILVGALVAVAVGATLNLLGVAIGATTVDAVGRDTPTAGALGIGAAIWFLVSNLIGLALGGYVAARLSGTADRMDASLHGLAVWATAYLVSAVLLGNVAAGVATTATNAVTGVVGGAASAVAGAAGAAAPALDPEAAIERARLALTGPSEPALMTTEQRAAEITAILGRRVTEGQFSQADRTRLNQLVAAEAGIPEQEAAQRIQGYEQQAQQTVQQAEQRAREAADAAASGAAQGAFWIFVALLVSAVAAVIGARIGVRDVMVLTARRA